MELLTAEEMRRAESRAIDSGATTGLALMERAGTACADAAGALADRPGRAAVLCGPGNNGGDGYVIARLLAKRGWSAEVFSLGDPARLPPDAAANAARWRETGAISAFHPGAATGADLAVDALFGAGLSRDVGVRLDPPSGKVLAVDGPSGLCLDTGRDRGLVAPADLTVTFHRARRGHHLGAGPDVCGRLVIADIGLDAAPCGALRMVEPPEGLLKRGGGHKYDHGHALMLSGGPGRGGAARLAARAALRAGAGLVTLGCSGAAMLENACRLDSVMLRRLDGPEALAGAAPALKIRALGLGPGMGLGETTRDRVLAALALNRPVVLDADALSAFADAPEALFAACRGGLVLMTPHGGEFARLFPDLAGAQDKVAATAEAARRSGATVLYKGRATVIATPDGDLALSAATYDRAAPQLATAGSGDVLAGLALGLLARGFSPFEAAKGAAWLHVEAARAFGPGLIAEDLVDAVPKALAGLER